MNQELLFVRIPKNASTSIYQHLGASNVIFRHADAFQANIHKPIYRGVFDPTHATPDEIAQIIPNFNQYLSFAVVRNPWDRMVSMYMFAQRKRLWMYCGLSQMPSFEAFCQLALDGFERGDQSFFPSNPQSLWLDGAFSPKEILCFENLEQDFGVFIEKNCIQGVNPKLPWLNSSHRKDTYRDFFTEKTRQIVQHVYDEDLKRFNYSF